MAQVRPRLGRDVRIRGRVGRPVYWRHEARHPTCHIELDDRSRLWIAGTSAKVIELIFEHVGYGWDAAEIHRQHPHVSLAKIHAALSYYYDNKELMEQQMREWNEEAEAIRKQLPEPELMRRLRREGKIQ